MYLFRQASVSDSYEKDLSKYEGQEIEFVISEFNPRRNRVIGEQKQLLVQTEQKNEKNCLQNCRLEIQSEGTVKNVTDFGAFIDLGGVERTSSHF